MSDVTTTQTLVQRAHDGDSVALNELYSRYSPRVLAAVRARLGAGLRSKVESWDIVQDAMLASLRNLNSFEHNSDGAFLNWLSKVVENRIRDQADFFHAGKRDHRKEAAFQGKQRSDNSEVPLDIADRDAGTPSQFLVLDEELLRLEAAMDRLPEEYRDLVIATKIEGRTYQELADESGKSPDSVRMQVNRSMVALTKAFRELDSESVNQ